MCGKKERREKRKRKRRYLHQNSPLAPLYSSTRQDTKKDTDVILNDDAWVHIEQKKSLVDTIHCFTATSPHAPHHSFSPPSSFSHVFEALVFEALVFEERGRKVLNLEPNLPFFLIFSSIVCSNELLRLLNFRDIYNIIKTNKTIIQYTSTPSSSS
jgi:hypothetical protein